MSDPTDIREHEREAAEREPAERSPEGEREASEPADQRDRTGDDAGVPAPPGQPRQA